MLEEDRSLAVVRWFRAAITDLPAPMRHELGVWFDVMRNGTAIPPRSRPRSDTTTDSQLRWALPALRQWAVEPPVAAGDRPRRRAGRPAAVGRAPGVPAAGAAVDLPHPQGPQAGVRQPGRADQRTRSPPRRRPPRSTWTSARRAGLRRPCPRGAGRAAGLPRGAHLPAVRAAADRRPRRAAARRRAGHPARRAGPPAAGPLSGLPAAGLRRTRSTPTCSCTSATPGPPGMSARSGSASSSACPGRPSAWTGSSTKPRPPAATFAPCATCSACPSPAPTGTPRSLTGVDYPERTGN